MGEMGEGPIRKGDVFSRVYRRQTPGYHYVTEQVQPFLVITSIRKSIVYAKECWNKHEARAPRGYCKRLCYGTVAEFTDYIRNPIWHWKRDTLDDEQPSPTEPPAPPDQEQPDGPVVEGRDG